MKWFKTFSTRKTDYDACDGHAWPLPNHSHPGHWTDRVSKLEPWRHGYHVFDRGTLFENLTMERVFEVQIRGNRIKLPHRFWVVQQARLVHELDWLPSTQMRFSLECFERVMPHYCRVEPNDIAPFAALAVVHDFLEGKAGATELPIAAERLSHNQPRKPLHWDDYAKADEEELKQLICEDGRFDFYNAIDWILSNTHGLAEEAMRSVAFAASHLEGGNQRAYEEERAYQYHRLFDYLYGLVPPISSISKQK